MEKILMDPAEAIEAEFREKWIDKKKDGYVLADVYESLGFDERSHRVRDCSTFLEYATPTDFSEKPKLHYANFCRDRLCPLCAWRRSRKIFGQTSEIMDIIEKDHRFIFLTLTVRSCSAEELPGVIDHMQKSWDEFAHAKQVKRAVKGYQRTLEITIHPEMPKAFEFHPHFHCILAVKPSYFHDTKQYMSQAKIKELWRTAAGLNYLPIVDIRKIRPGEMQKEVSPEKLQEYSIKSAVAEVAKYSVKSSDYLKGSMKRMRYNVLTLLSSIAGRRLVSYGGVFKDAKRKLGLDDVIDGDLIHADAGDKLREDLEYILFRYRWFAGIGYDLTDVRPLPKTKKADS